MNCITCNKPIVDVDGAVDDGQGLGLRMHRACLEGAKVSDLETPAYQHVGASVSMPPKQDWSAMRPVGVNEETGQPIYQAPKPASQPARKAASEPEPVSLGQCQICHRGVQEGQDVVRHKGLVGHRSCLEALASLMQ